MGYNSTYTKHYDYYNGKDFTGMAAEVSMLGAPLSSNYSSYTGIRTGNSTGLIKMPVIEEEPHHQA